MTRRSTLVAPVATGVVISFLELRQNEPLTAISEGASVPAVSNIINVASKRTLYSKESKPYAQPIAVPSRINHVSVYISCLRSCGITNEALVALDRLPLAPDSLEAFERLAGLWPEERRRV